MSTAAFSHIGNVRKENEDSYYYNDFEKLYIVADGIGGHQAGKEASRLAIHAFIHIYNQYKNNSPVEIIEAGFSFANEQVYQYQKEHFPKDIVGTTLTVALIRDSILYIGHVGDSRAYLSIDSNIMQLTEDHTYFAELAKFDEITKDKLENNEINTRKNFLLKAIGPELEVIPQILEINFESSSKLLLVTDGLYRYLSIDEISSLVFNLEITELANTMQDIALSRGGKDNITMIVHTEKEGESGEKNIRGTI